MKKVKLSSYDSNGVNNYEAPDGFYATIKNYKGKNICEQCEARKLCQENKDNWCLKNRCMSYDVVDKNGITHRRKDGKPVVFKKVNEIHNQASQEDTARRTKLTNLRG